MRQIDAGDRCDRHEMAIVAPSAHATADLIGDTWVTTTTSASAARRRARRTPREPAGRARPATRHRSARSRRPPASGPTPPTVCRPWRRPRRFRSSARSTARRSRTAMPNASAVSVARRSGLLISTSTAPTCSATMAACLRPTSSSGSSMRPCSRPAALRAVRPWRTRISTPSVNHSARVEQSPGAQRRQRRRDGSRRGRPAATPRRRSPGRSPRGGGSTSRAAPTAAARRRSTRPVNGHQNTSVVAHAPSNTRCRNVADRQPEQQLAARLAPDADQHHDDEQGDAERPASASTASRRARASSSGSTAPTISRR